MAWQTPKTDWAAEDGVLNTDLNRIEANTQYLYDAQSGLSTNVSLYVSVTGGNDTTGDGTEAAPYATINKAFSMLPKNLNGYMATVYVAAGSYPEVVYVQDFYGGYARLSGWGSGAAVSLNNLVITRVTHLSILTFSTLTINQGMSANNGASVFVQVPVASSVASATAAVRVNAADLTFSNTVTISNKTQVAVQVYSGGIVVFNTLAGTNNATAVSATDGGTVHANSFTISGTVKFNTAGGGRIYAGAQSSIPQY